MGPRVFSLEEADGLIPDVEAVFQELDALRERAATVKKKMDVLEMIHGAEILKTPTPDGREYRLLLDEVGGLRKQFEEACGRIVELGGHLKGVDEGLVDFCGVIDGRLVELCWKRGEDRISHFHHIGEGFPGRRPLP